MSASGVLCRRGEGLERVSGAPEECEHAWSQSTSRTGGQDTDGEGRLLRSGNLGRGRRVFSRGEDVDLEGICDWCWWRS